LFEFVPTRAQLVYGQFSEFLDLHFNSCVEGLELGVR
jgi:hypothetical protein